MLSQLRNSKEYFILAFLLVFLLPVTILSQVPDEQYMAGSAYFLKEDFDKAVESYSIAITRNNSDDQLFIKRGSAFLKINETENAVKDFNEANLINPHTADLWLARTFAMDGEHAKAVQYLKSHLNSEFRIAEDSIKKDPAFNSLQDSPEWYELWQKEWYSNVEKKLGDASYYMKRKQYDQAVSLLDEEILGNPGNPLLITSRGKVFMKQGNYAAAAGDFSSALSIDKTITGVYAPRGYAHLKTGRYKEAVSDLTKAIKEDPADFNLYLQRAEAQAGQLNWTSAIKDIQLYMKYFEDDLQVLYQCGEYYFAAGDYMNALKNFNLLLKEYPNNSVYYKARGKTYVKTAMYRYAISDLSMALDLNPVDAETWMYHGIASIKTGDKDKGCSSLHKAQDMGNTEAVKQILENCQ